MPSKQLADSAAVPGPQGRAATVVSSHSRAALGCPLAPEDAAKLRAWIKRDGITRVALALGVAKSTVSNAAAEGGLRPVYRQLITDRLAGVA